MTSESYLLQFCYQCDLKGPIGDSFEVLKKRIQWNFESYLEDLRRKNRELKVRNTNNNFKTESKHGLHQKDLVTFYKRRFEQLSFKQTSSKFIKNLCQDRAKRILKINVI